MSSLVLNIQYYLNKFYIFLSVQEMVLHKYLILGYNMLGSIANQV